MANTTRRLEVNILSQAKAIVVTVPTPDLHVTVAQVKQSIGNHLGLKQRSVQIFGIFVGPLGLPKALLDDRDVLYKSVSSVCFQRLSFDRDLELSVVSEDDNAVKILFGEIKHEYNRFKVLPAPGFSEMKLLDEILSKESLCQEEDRFDKQMEFFKLICNLPTYYWGYYYRAENCTMLNSTLPANSAVERGMKVHLIVSSSDLILLEPAAANGQEILKLSWSKVQSIIMQKYPKMLIKFETVISYEVDDNTEKELVLISLGTDRCEYVYTLTQHIFGLLRSQASGGLLSPPVVPVLARSELLPVPEHCCVNAAFSKEQ